MNRLFHRFYNFIAVICCLLLIGVLLYAVSLLPHYGEENPRSAQVVQRYVEDGLSETGATNIVAGMILDYRAFDTLGESHVLFTALICVIILLGKDKKNMRKEYDSYYTVEAESYHLTQTDPYLLRIQQCTLDPDNVSGILYL